MMFEKAIKIILSEPPELHYPSYYADLLRESSSEIPNSSDLISRKDAISAVNTALFPKLNTAKDAEKALRLLPPAEPERKKGKWIVDALANNIYRCSECGTDAPVEPTGGTEYKSNYCPNCGADMGERRTNG